MENLTLRCSFEAFPHEYDQRVCWWYTADAGESPAEGYKDDEGTGASLL